MKLLFWKFHMGMLLVNVQSEQYLLPGLCSFFIILTLFRIGGKKTSSTFFPCNFYKRMNLKQEYPSKKKKRFFWSNSYKIEVMKTSLIEMLKLPNFSQMITSKVLFESRDKTLLEAS